MCCSAIQTSETIISFCSFFKGNKKKYLTSLIIFDQHILNVNHFSLRTKNNNNNNNKDLNPKRKICRVSRRRGHIRHGLEGAQVTKGQLTLCLFLLFIFYLQRTCTQRAIDQVIDHPEKFSRGDLFWQNGEAAISFTFGLGRHPSADSRDHKGGTRLENKGAL